MRNGMFPIDYAEPFILYMFNFFLRDTENPFTAAQVRYRNDHPPYNM